MLLRESLPAASVMQSLLLEGVDLCDYIESQARAVLVSRVVFVPLLIWSPSTAIGVLPVNDAQV